MPQPELQDYIKFYLSGGQNNTEPDLSLGGQISQTQLADPLQLYDRLKWNETWYGYTDYRCIYVKNTHPTKTAYDMVGYITQGVFDGTGGDSPEFITFQYDPAGVGDGINSGVAFGPTANEETEPTGVNFPADPPETEDEAIESSMGHYELQPGQCVAVWFKRSVGPNVSVTGFTRAKFTVVVGE